MARNLKTKVRLDFYYTNNYWVDFLNRDIEENKRNKEMSGLLEEISIEHGLIKLEESKNSFSTVFKYESDFEFVLACQTFMLENLKRFDWEGKKDIIEVNGFFWEEINALMSLVKIGFFDRKTGFPSFEIKEDCYELTDMFYLPRIIMGFLNYFNQLSVKGIDFELGYNKICVCRYKRTHKTGKLLKKCERAFYATSQKSQACKEHVVLWSNIKNDHKTRKGNKKVKK